MKISQHTIVAFRYAMYDKAGELLQDTTRGASTCYLHGGTSVDPTLQDQLAGLEAGQTSHVHFSDESGTYLFHVVIDSVRNATQEEVLLGYPLEKGCEPDCECYSFHP